MDQNNNADKKTKSPIERIRKQFKKEAENPDPTVEELQKYHEKKVKRVESGSKGSSDKSPKKKD